MATNNIPTQRQRNRDNTPYDIPLDDTPPEEFVEAAKELVDGRGVEKLWDQFIDQLTEELVYEGPLADHLDEDTMEVGADWVIVATMRRFGFEWAGVPAEYRSPGVEG
jgi:nucleotide-binding universal stress UspA family protein